MAEFAPIFDDGDYADEEEEDMGKKSNKGKSDLELAAEGAQNIVDIGKQGYGAVKSVVGFFKDRETREREKKLSNLKDEVQKLETQKTIDEQIKELEAKKKRLKEDLNKQKDEFAYA